MSCSRLLKSFHETNKLNEKINITQNVVIKNATPTDAVESSLKTLLLQPWNTSEYQGKIKNGKSHPSTSFDDILQSNNETKTARPIVQKMLESCELQCVQKVTKETQNMDYGENKITFDCDWFEDISQDVEQEKNEGNSELFNGYFIPEKSMNEKVYMDVSLPPTITTPNHNQKNIIINNNSPDIEKREYNLCDGMDQLLGIHCSSLILSNGNPSREMTDRDQSVCSPNKESENDNTCLEIFPQDQRDVLKSFLEIYQELWAAQKHEEANVENYKMQGKVLQKKNYELRKKRWKSVKIN